MAEVEQVPGGQSSAGLLVDATVARPAVGPPDAITCGTSAVQRGDGLDGGLDRREDDHPVGV